MTDIAVAVLARKGTYRAVYTVRFAEAIAEELQVKARLTHHISNRIKTLGLTQVQAGERLGVGQPDVSKLMHGRYTGYSTDRLMALLNALDVDVEIVVRLRSENESLRRGSVRVMEAVA
jgi:predicted XRE-type DNA-binding protein